MWQMSEITETEETDPVSKQKITKKKDLLPKPHP